jgi:hypothetical protein
VRITPSGSSTTLNEEELPSTSRDAQMVDRRLHRSPSSVSQYRQRSSPAGLMSYTGGSNPPSRTNSRADLYDENKTTGSVRTKYYDPIKDILKNIFFKSGNLFRWSGRLTEKSRFIWLSVVTGIKVFSEHVSHGQSEKKTKTTIIKNLIIKSYELRN